MSVCEHRRIQKLTEIDLEVLRWVGADKDLNQIVATTRLHLRKLTASLARIAHATNQYHNELASADRAADDNDVTDVAASSLRCIAIKLRSLEFSNVDKKLYVHSSKLLEIEEEVDRGLQ